MLEDPEFFFMKKVTPNQSESEESTVTEESDQCSGNDSTKEDVSTVIDRSDEWDKDTTTESDAAIINVLKDESSLNKGMEILNKKKSNSNDFWESGTVVQRFGKATGKYKHFWYVCDPASGEMVEHDTEKVWESWKLNLSDRDSGRRPSSPRQGDR